jgi:small GTP-binding protein
MDLDISDLETSIFKVLVVGELRTGKTSLIRQYVQGYFTGLYKETIGVDFACKALTLEDQTKVQLQLWDIGGHERCRNLTRVFYQEAVGAFVVFDLTRPATLDAAADWKKDIDSKVFAADKKPIPCLLIGNKVDLCESLPTTDGEMAKFVAENKFIGYMTMSAKTRANLTEVIVTLVNYIHQNHIEPYLQREGVSIATPERKRDKCCS